MGQNEISLIQDAAERAGVTFNELVSGKDESILLDIANEEYQKQACEDARTGG